MKKLTVLAIVFVLVVVSFSAVYAAPWNSSKGVIADGVDCGGGTFSILMLMNSSASSWNMDGNVGITKSLWIDFPDDGVSGLVPVWAVPGLGIAKKTVWCTWDFEGLPMGGDILLP